MPNSLPRHPALMLRGVLLEAWNPDATGGLDPNIPPRQDRGLSMNRGWFNTVSFPVHVAIRAENGENTLGGGDSGYSGIDPSGAGPTQLRSGNLSVNVFAEDDQRYGTGDMDAEAVRDAIRDEIEDIVMAAAADDSDRDVETPDPWTNISSSWDFDRADTDATPTVFRSQLRVRYSWMRLP